jgi:MFS family permease
MGRLSDRLGRRSVLFGLAAVSAVFSLSIGWLVAWPVYLLVALALVYNFAAIGDSPVLSTAITEVIEPGYLGAVLALRSLLGFGAGTISPRVFGLVLDISNPAGASPVVWGWAFMMLGVGGVIAAVCAYSLSVRRG